MKDDKLAEKLYKKWKDTSRLKDPARSRHELIRFANLAIKAGGQKIENANLHYGEKLFCCRCNKWIEKSELVISKGRERCPKCNTQIRKSRRKQTTYNKGFRDGYNANTQAPTKFRNVIREIEKRIEKHFNNIYKHHGVDWNIKTAKEGYGRFAKAMKALGCKECLMRIGAITELKETLARLKREKVGR